MNYDHLFTGLLGIALGVAVVMGIAAISHHPTPDERMGAKLTGQLCAVWENASDDIDDEMCNVFCDATFQHRTQEKECRYGYVDRIVRLRIVEAHGEPTQ